VNDAVATRYAAALADVALEQKTADRVKQDLAALIEAFSSAADLRIFLESPAAARQAKQKVVETLASRMDLSPAVRNFVHVLVDHRRTEMLAEIQRAFQAELNRRLGIAEAEVISARELTTAEKQRLTTALERRTGMKMEAHFRTDQALLGGLVVRIGSTVYDGSVREQLARLRMQLEAE